jgi:hypothetical protein
MASARTIRLTIDLPLAEHRRLQTESGKAALSMRAYAHRALLTSLDQDKAATVHNDTQALLDIMRQEHAEQLRTLTDRADSHLASVRQDLGNHISDQTERLEQALEDLRNQQPNTPGPNGPDGIEQMDRLVELLNRLTPVPALMAALQKTNQDRVEIDNGFISALTGLSTSVDKIQKQLKTP